MNTGIFLTLTLLAFLVSSKANAQCCGCTLMGDELIKNGSFEEGNTGFTTDYIFSNTATPGRYGIALDPNTANPGNWRKCTDHTTGTGKMMWVDLSASSSLNVWSQDVNGIQPGKNYLITCWVNTLDPHTPATLRFAINGVLTGRPFTAPTATCQWLPLCFLWKSGSNSSAKLSIINQSFFNPGNDVALDDISFRECISPLPLVQDVDAIICPGDTYQFSNGRTVSLPGLYHDTIAASISCDTIKNISLSVASVDTGTFDITLCKELLPYQWNNHTYTASGTYSLRVNSSIGCDSIAVLKLSTYPDDGSCTVYFPNSFTPNGDGKNDVFHVINTRNMEFYQLTVYNRMGQKIFETGNPQSGWNGTYNGTSLPTGNFIWFCRYKRTGQDEVTRKGFVLLIR